MRRKLRSRSSLQTAFNNRKYITRRIRLTISTRPPIPRQLASLTSTLFVHPAINLSLSSSLAPPFAVTGLSIFILLLVHIPRRCVYPLTHSYLCSRSRASARGDNLHDRHIPELASVLRRHARLIHIRDTSPCALHVYSLLSQLDATLFAKQRTLSNKKILRTQRELAAYRNNCSTTEIIFHLHYIMNYFRSCLSRLSPPVTKDINGLYLPDNASVKLFIKSSI